MIAKIIRKVFKVKLKNNGANREEKNLFGEAGDFVRNVLIGEEFTAKNGDKIIRKDSIKNYNKKKVVAGSVVGVAGLVATGAGVAYAVDAKKKKDSDLLQSDEDFIGIEDGDIPTIEGEVIETSETNE